MIAWVGLTISAAIVLYILFGYPIALALSRGTRRHVAKDLNFRCTVTLIMTVYNGANFLRKKLDSILNLGYPAELLQILVVSDGSTDDTEAIASEYTDRGVELIRAAQHVGKAACLNLAMARARGSILFFTDVRQPLHGRALSHLVANFADPTVGAVTGELQYCFRSSAGQRNSQERKWNGGMLNTFPVRPDTPEIPFVIWSYRS